jgi:hypothetical protein
MSAGKKPSVCPNCGKPASGNFCQHCGAALGGRFCNKCGAKVSGGASFCNQCGAPVKGGPQVSRKEAAAAAVGGSNAAWWAAGVAMFMVILIVGWNMTRRDGPSQAEGTAPAAGNPATGQSTLDLSSMTPREAADRLFNRVMSSISSGDTAAALSFQPMAVQAYQVIEGLDIDGLFHQGLLEMLANPSAALATADRILEADPDHLFGLNLAAQAALGMEDLQRAVASYQRLVDVFSTQVARSLPEYQAHQGLVDQMPAEAQGFLAAH